MIDSILTNTVLPRISLEILSRMREGQPVTRVEVSVRSGDLEYAFA